MHRALVLSLFVFGCTRAAEKRLVAPPRSSPAPASTAKGCPEGSVAVDAGELVLAATNEEVHVDAHCIDRTEVTVAAFARCVEKGSCTPPDAFGTGNAATCNWKRPGHDAHPINCVDVEQAIAFCAFEGGRLPTEAEWEWSARGYAAGTKFPWGDDAPGARACWTGPGTDLPEDHEGTCPAGAHATGANPRGVLDLAGNVWEYTSTKVGDQFIDKGGGWLNGVPSRLLSSGRNPVDGKERASSRGFRCVRPRP